MWEVHPWHRPLRYSLVWQNLAGVIHSIGADERT